MSLAEFIAIAVGFIVCVILVPILIPILHRFKFGQQVREEGPEAHLAKSGTPTMGGIAIIIAFIFGTVFFATKDMDMLAIVITTVLFAIIGGLDDGLKIKKKQSEGLKAWQKFLLQMIVTAAMMLYVGLVSDAGTTMIVPFYGEVNFGGWFWPIAFLAILGTENGANFTDGLDGLVSSVTIVIGVFLAFAAQLLESGVTPAVMAMMGALLAFLCFNTYPAKIFMGDTGALALGGFVAMTAMVLKLPIFLIISAFVYLAEILSVIMQVSYFKLTHGKRIFKMTPIHHHFEQCGWKETRVVYVFTLATIILCALSYFGLVKAL